MIKFLIPLLVCATVEGQIVLSGGRLNGGVLGTTNLTSGGGGGGDINSGLTHHWKLDENTGTTAADTVGSDTGTFHAGTDTSWALPKIGVSAVGFESGSSAGGIHLASTVTMTAPCSYATWFYPSNDANGSYQALISQDGSHGIYALGAGAGKVKIDLFTGSDHTTTATATTNAWHSVVVVFTASTTANIYIDGVLDALSPVTVSAPINVVGFGSDSGTGAEGLRGRMDDILTYNIAKVQADITALFNSSTGPTP